MRIRNTERSHNLQVPLPDGRWSLDEMEALLVAAAAELGLAVSHVTTLGRVRFPGNRHWHFKQRPDETGCLDVTYWPDGAALWVTMRVMEPPWVHRQGKALHKALERLLADSCRAERPAHGES